MTLITTVVSHRTVEIQTDPLAPPLIVTRTALIAASRAVVKAPAPRRRRQRRAVA